MENFTAVKIAPGLLKKAQVGRRWTWKQQGWLGGGDTTCNWGAAMQMLLSRVEKKPQKILPWSGRDGRLLLWRLDIVLRLSLSLGVTPAVQLWVTGHAGSWEPSHRYSNHLSYTHILP